MDPEALLLFILTSQLQIQEVTSRTTDVSLYSRSGQDVFLSCLNTSPGDTTCSLVSWIYSIDQIQSSFVVKEGKVERRFAQGSRLSLDTRCSLVIRNVTAEDVGGYTCRQGQDVNRDEQVSLSVMTVSPSEAGSDPGGVGEVTLRCTVRRPPGFFCLVGSLRWRDEAGTELRAEGTGRTLLRQTCCVSMVTVRRQAGPNRKYTCQFVDAEGIAIRADYTPDFSGTS
uniref:Ig-like domain-containing protein n=1 Tax=Gasterosteus aculeatus TaxID=69293 RepID=G3PE63_GASAC